MIIDRLDRAARYQALHPDLAAAIRWAGSKQALSLAPGRHDLRGDELFVIVEEGVTRGRSEKRLEAHRRYVDLQVVLSGGEIMDWCPLAGLREAEAHPDRDLWFYDDPAQGVLAQTVPPGSCTIFLPDDAHRPGIQLPSGPAAYRKLVFKLAVAGLSG